MCPLGWFISLLQKVFFIQKNESQRFFWRDDYISTKFGCILRFVGSRRDVDCFLPAQKNYIFEIREFCLTQKHNFRHAVKGRLEKFDIRQTIHISSSENLVWGLPTQKHQPRAAWELHGHATPTQSMVCLASCDWRECRGSAFYMLALNLFPE